MRLRRSSAPAFHSLGKAAALFVCCLSLGCPRNAYLANDLKPFHLEHDQIKDLRSVDEVRFLVFGDSGEKGEPQRIVAEKMETACASNCDFALVLGDNIYASGVDSVNDPEFEKRFAKVYDPLGRMDFWVVPGNHDWRSFRSVQAEIDYTGKSTQWRMPYNHYPVPLLPDWLHIYGLDTSVMDEIRPTTDKKTAALKENMRTQFNGAKETLSGKPGWRLLFGHHAVYSGGARHGYENGNCAVLPSIRDTVEKEVIKKYGVDVYFAGHDHHQEFLVAKNANYYQVIQGAAAKLRNVHERHKYDAEHDVQQRFACSQYGFLLATAKPGFLTLTFFGCPEKGDSTFCREIYEASLSKSSEGKVTFTGNKIGDGCAEPVKPAKSCSPN